MLRCVVTQLSVSASRTTTKSCTRVASHTTKTTTTTTTVPKRWQSNSTTPASGPSPNNASTAAATIENSTSTSTMTAAEREAYMKEANAKMEAYHNTRELLRAGKLPKHASARAVGPPPESNAAALGVVGVFLILFCATPFLGKRIAQDEEFRKKWIPSWYDYTVPKPTSAWTREELHEQMLQTQKIIHERALAGEFTKEKLEEIQRSLYGMDLPQPATTNTSSKPSSERSGGDSSIQPSVNTASSSGEGTPEQRAAWAKLHPGVEKDEQVYD